MAHSLDLCFQATLCQCCLAPQRYRPTLSTQTRTANKNLIEGWETQKTIIALSRYHQLNVTFAPGPQAKPHQPWAEPLPLSILRPAAYAKSPTKSSCSRSLPRPFLFYWSSICQHITPSVHPIKCPPQCPSPSYPIPLPTFPSTTLCSFPRVRVSHGLSPSLIFPLIFPTFPYNPFHYFSYSLYEWSHMMIKKEAWDTALFPLITFVWDIHISDGRHKVLGKKRCLFLLNQFYQFPLTVFTFFLNKRNPILARQMISWIKTTFPSLPCG